jgi:transposase
MNNSHLVKERDHKALERRRLSAGTLFGKGVSQYKVAKHFKVSTAAANQWHQAWAAKGEDGLLSKGNPGFASVYTEEKKKNLKSLILEGPKKCGYATDFWTVERIVAVARAKLGVKLQTTQTWRTVVSLGFSCQKPERRAKERKERAIKGWRIETFPRLKKMGLA